jgi:predicted metal-dependent hydrolase
MTIHAVKLLQSELNYSRHQAIHYESICLHNDIQIQYALLLRRRKTLAIKVHPDQSVTVTAPLGISPLTIRDLVHARGAWILRKQAYFAEQPHKIETDYTEGALHQYLGKPYRLEITAHRFDSVELKGDCLQIYSRSPHDSQKTQQLLTQWYKRQAKAVFSERLQHCFKILQTHPQLAHLFPFQLPSFSIRMMKRRWGSCSSEKTLLLNTLLIKAPLSCIDYVINHELCHLREFNHSAAFYALLETLMPHWQDYRQQLNQFGRIYC